MVGLGNPGPRYANTRHNVGFMVVDELARRLEIAERDWKTKDNARQVRARGRQLILVEPQSFMNESGVPARLTAARYKVPNDRILVIYDELDLPFGRLRMRERGSSACHNGMKSIIAYFGQELPRLRIGIGRAGEDDAIDRVLARFTAAERRHLPVVIGVAADAAMCWVEEDFSAASNLANAWRLEEEVSNPNASPER